MRQAQRASLGITVARFGGYAAFGAALFTALVTLLLALLMNGAVAPATLAVFTAVLAGVGTLLTRRAARDRKAQKQALDQAQVLVAADLLAARAGLDGARVAELLGTTAEQAELLLAEVNVNKLLASGMTDVNRERIDYEPAALEAELLPPLEPTVEAPPLGAADISPPLAGPGRRS